MDRCCGFADVFLRPISGHDSAAEATHHATSFWIGADSGRRYSCCIVRLGFCVRFPYNTCGGAHGATFSFEPRLGHGCGSCSAGGGALFTEVPLAPDERLGAANHAQIPCYPTKGPTDCYRKNTNRAQRDPPCRFQRRLAGAFSAPIHSATTTADTGTPRRIDHAVRDFDQVVQKKTSKSICTLREINKSF